MFLSGTNKFKSIILKGYI